MKKKQLHKSNRLVTMLLLVMAILMPYGGAWAQTQPSKGDGKVGNPYIITKAAELAWFRDQVNGGKFSKCAKLTADIDLKDFCHAADASKKELSWEPIGNDSILEILLIAYNVLIINANYEDKMAKETN